MLMERVRSALLVIDLQARLMPAIDGGEAVVANAGRLLEAARRLDVPALLTEQNPRGLGPTVPGLTADAPALAKMTFNAVPAPGFGEALPDRPQVVVSGCEAHVCVLQTVLGLVAAGRDVYVVADAVGSRRPESRAAALDRMERAGATIVTTEMVLFEWLESADDPRFKELVALIK